MSDGVLFPVVDEVTVYTGTSVSSLEEEQEVDEDEVFEATGGVYSGLGSGSVCVMMPFPYV